MPEMPDVMTPRGAAILVIRRLATRHGWIEHDSLRDPSHSGDRYISIMIPLDEDHDDRNGDDR